MFKDHFITVAVKCIDFFIYLLWGCGLFGFLTTFQIKQQVNYFFVFFFAQSGKSVLLCGQLNTWNYVFTASMLNDIKWG